MHDLDAIKAINIEQLVTPMDRLLLSSGDVGRAPTRRSFDLSHEAALAVAASQRRQAPHGAAEKTYVMRAQHDTRELVDVAYIAAFVAWLFVAAVCLLA
ncbi:MAG TPA: hypothetical protein VLB44_06920 [Kofleriaceae bacterium]|nr:hypothetical protein [Kofleriaceae bacterium]